MARQIAPVFSELAVSHAHGLQQGDQRDAGLPDLDAEDAAFRVEVQFVGTAFGNIDVEVADQHIDREIVVCALDGGRNESHIPPSEIPKLPRRGLSVTFSETIQNYSNGLATMFTLRRLNCRHCGGVNRLPFQCVCADGRVRRRTSGGPDVHRPREALGALTQLPPCGRNAAPLSQV